MSWHAWVDESEPARFSGPSAYVMGALLCEPDEIGDVRDSLRALLLPGQRKLHWRDEDSGRRRKIVETIASHRCVEHVVVIRPAVVGERPERRRRHCLERLWYELDQLSVRSVYQEARNSKQDQLDRDMLTIARVRRTVSPSVRVEHVYGFDDPGLWAADAICGAFGSHYSGVTDAHLSTIQGSATVHRLMQS